MRELSDEGVIIRSRDSVQYTYTPVPHAYIPDVTLSCMVEQSDPVRMKAAKQKEKELEWRGFGEEQQQYIRTCLVLPGAPLRLPVLPCVAKTNLR